MACVLSSRCLLDHDLVKRITRLHLHMVDLHPALGIDILVCERQHGEGRAQLSTGGVDACATASGSSAAAAAAT